MAMTSNKAQKAVARERMARTGEPYSVARRATGAGPGDSGLPETPEQRYVREAGEAGASAADIEALRFGLQAQERADQLREAAEHARALAEQAEELATRAEERAGMAEEAAELAEEWAEEDDLRLAHERAGRMQEAAEQ